MRMNSPVFIHIGLHKTGTTTLQEDIFKRFFGIKIIDRTVFAKEIMPFIKTPFQ